MTESTNQHERDHFASSKRILRVLALTLGLVASLLAFPGGIVGMTAGWFAAYTVAVVRSRPAAWLLAVWVGVILIKRVDWPPVLWGLMALTGALLIVAAAQFRPSRRIAHLAVVALWGGWLAFAADAYRATHAAHAVNAPAGRPVVCIGDSLTSFTKQGGYPELLAELVAVPVINLGQPGITSTEALKMLPELQAARPCAVVIELGGHDFLKDDTFLKRRSRAVVRRNLETIIAAAEEAGAEIILMEVPRGFVVDPFAGLERELARTHDLELIADTTIRRFVLNSPVAPPGSWLGGPYLSDDGLHPNERGNALLARRVLAALERLYGDGV